MTQKKYLSLEEAAERVGLSRDEVMRLREKGDLRGFADRGTWKFKYEDVEELARRRQANSDPDLPFLVDDPESGSALSISDDELGEQPTIIRGGKKDDSDIKLESGDVHGSWTKKSQMDSDSDINLTKEWGSGKPLPKGAAPRGEQDSDSDVRAVEETLLSHKGNPDKTEAFVMDSDSDVKLVDDAPGRPAVPFAKELKGSDSEIRLTNDVTSSEIRLIPDRGRGGSDSNASDVRTAADSMASDIRLAPLDNDVSDIRKSPIDNDVSDIRFAPQEAPSDSDVALLRPGDSSIALDFTPDEGEGASVLTDESGIALAGDSAMMLASESGISLEGPSDSGISLESRDEEGITLADDAGIGLLGADSGITLDSPAKSGPKKGGAKQGGGTLPMMDIPNYRDEGTDTSFEIPSLRDDSAYDLETVKPTPKSEKTAKLPAFSSSESVDDAVFNIDDGDAALDSGADEELEVIDDAFGEDDDLGDDLDVIDADEEVFAADEEDSEFAAPVAGRYVPVEQEWGAGVMVGVSVCSVLLLLVGAVMFDLVKTMWVPGQANAVAGPVLDALSGLYK